MWEVDGPAASDPWLMDSAWNDAPQAGMEEPGYLDVASRRASSTSAYSPSPLVARDLLAYEQLEGAIASNVIETITVLHMGGREFDDSEDFFEAE